MAWCFCQQPAFVMADSCLDAVFLLHEWPWRGSHRGLGTPLQVYFLLLLLLAHLQDYNELQCWCPHRNEQQGSRMDMLLC
jgi:hypothetical protein